ncbi:hypothetical protein BX600DRAFT_163627 [Xylariales sp. PMI_506]|nr:hypothetical protein BX600DRAFT_163627 [Xylariales sp. PMI_506]
MPPPLVGSSFRSIRSSLIQPKAKGLQVRVEKGRKRKKHSPIPPHSLTQAFLPWNTVAALTSQEYKNLPVEPGVFVTWAPILSRAALWFFSPTAIPIPASIPMPMQMSRP